MIRSSFKNLILLCVVLIMVTLLVLDHLQSHYVRPMAKCSSNDCFKAQHSSSEISNVRSLITSSLDVVDDLNKKEIMRSAQISQSEADLSTGRAEVTIPLCSKESMLATRQVYSVKCAAIVDNDEAEMEKAKEMRKHRVTDETVAKQTSHCLQLRSRYMTCAYSEEELQYPIAFSILCHSDAVQVERLLRVLYQPQNVYCIHPDAKSSTHFHRALNNIAKCFPNVFIASKLETVVYASYSRLQAEVNCFKDLLGRPEKWNYLINLVEQVFPLKTNAEIVKILKIYNGANDIEAQDYYMYFRTQYKHAVVNGKIKNTKQKKTEPIPGKLKLIKGSAYGVFSRAFLQWAMEDATAKAFLQWSNDTRTPDEHYWATLNHLQPNPDLNSPGGYHGIPHKKPWLAVYVAWANDKAPCHGLVIRQVCIFGIKDLPDLVNKKFLFANKFYVNYQFLTLECLAEWYHNRTVEKPYFNTTYYEQLPFVLRK